MTIHSEADLLMQQAIAHHQAGQIDEAEPIYSGLLQQFPDNATLLTNLGTILYQKGEYQPALDMLDKSLEISFYQAIALNSRGICLEALERLSEALSSYNCALSIESNYVEAHYNKGHVLQELEQYPKALQSYDKTIDLKPDHAQAYCNRGVVLNALNRFDAALLSYQQAIYLNPEYSEAYYNLGNLQFSLLRYQDAMASFNKAIELNPNYIEAIYNLGNVQLFLNLNEDAILNFTKAIELKTDFYDGFVNCALAYRKIKQLDIALTTIDKAILLNNNDPVAYLYRGHILFDLLKLEDAIKSYTQAIELNPEYGDAIYNRGMSYKYLMRYEEAYTDFLSAEQLKSEQPYLSELIWYSKMNICLWDDFSNEYDRLFKKINDEDELAVPFIMLAFADQLSFQNQVAERYVTKCFPVNLELSPIKPYPKHNKIRIVYISGDFRNHPVAHLTAAMFDLHDRNQFEVIAFAIGPDIHDAIRAKFEQSFDHFYNVQKFTDKEVAQFARILEVDIIVDLNGHTAYSRTGIFAYRAAPIQVNYLGYAGTLGAEYFDYIIADKVVIPIDKQCYYTEKVVYMPDSYMVTNNSILIPNNTFTRSSVGLPEQGFVFCCFNQVYKIHPEVFSAWMRILLAVEDSVLWLPHSNATAIKNLKAEAINHGISAERLIFAPRLASIEDHLNRVSLADLFLDTLPFNAHTTASDALRVGVPVLTCMGESFVGRVAASLLTALNLPELITENRDAYEALAIDLASHPEKLAHLKAKLLANLSVAPLYNTPLFTQHLESAYKKMMERYQEGLEPDHIYIEPC